MLECVEVELERRLSLYQTFLKLYEHHGSLLDEILKLNSFGSNSITGVRTSYFQGVVDGSSVYASTNLCQGKTVSLQQPQSFWTLGRDKNNGIKLADSYVSRSHAAIYYEEQKFYLVDFKSTNGSYVNGERIFKSIQIKDGDHIRLGNTTFDFFLSENTCILPSVVLEQIMQIDKESVEQTTITRNICQQESTNLHVWEDTRYSDCLPKPSELLNFEQSQEIVDYFLSKNEKMSLLDELT